MPRPMRQSARQVTDRALICAMLDQMEVLHIGIHDEPSPYVVPVNFGYRFEDALVLYFHCAQEGYKLELLARNPNVSATAASFISYAGGSVRGHMHDYRCVMARGVARRIDPDTEKEEFDRAYRLLLAHNHRTPMPQDAPVMRFIQLWRIDCPAQEVTAKAEIVPRSVEEVGFAPAVPDGVELDERHITEGEQR